uniref:Uncharacterized protein n=1 Tax=Chromera velia CCMP2878 TaxID=1169474 RepID=A0A0G4FBG0_9ALVE|eukprot:Cvel_3028.t1-p1 / transcript=Cvel_3028.t1 / gene=Cvel_3028 / organism=Chromera_velia_CCMP2878 / gene_product=hypothetical protein / transcript_product=hypothetical protein / location=Cvel_scaffold121:28577-29128(-) / protein_length=184 / sequence_SO=supercontig / SO=protein_coding / is_pseudo=false
MFFSIPEEAIVALNNESLGGETDAEPVEVSYLLRASVWYAELCHSEGDEPRGLWELWADIATALQKVSIREEFRKATQSSFASKEASEDALRLFKMVVRGFEVDGELEISQRHTVFQKRLMVLECTLPNPEVAKYIDENKATLLAGMRGLWGGAGKFSSAVHFRSCRSAFSWRGLRRRWCKQGS